VAKIEKSAQSRKEDPVLQSNERRYVLLEEKERREKKGKGRMTVQEAGRKGGMKTAETHGREFYEKIGHMGGQKVKELIEEGKKALGRSG
ncbi:hypothetical protein, partial [Methanothrix soehngenii]